MQKIPFKKPPANLQDEHNEHKPIFASEFINNEDQINKIKNIPLNSNKTVPYQMIQQKLKQTNKLPPKVIEQENITKDDLPNEPQSNQPFPFSSLILEQGEPKSNESPKNSEQQSYRGLYRSRANHNSNDFIEPPSNQLGPINPSQLLLSDENRLNPFAPINNTNPFKNTEWPLTLKQQRKRQKVSQAGMPLTPPILKQQKQPQEEKKFAGQGLFNETNLSSNLTPPVKQLTFKELQLKMKMSKLSMINKNDD